MESDSRVIHKASVALIEASSQRKHTAGNSSNSSLNNDGSLRINEVFTLLSPFFLSTRVQFKRENEMGNLAEDLNGLVAYTRGDIVAGQCLWCEKFAR